MTLAYDEAAVTVGDTFTVPVAVDTTLSEVDFEITCYGEVLSATVTLFDPLGDPYPIDPATDCDTYGTGVDAETTCYVGYLDPAGDWTISVEAASDVYVAYYVSCWPLPISPAIAPH